MLQELYHYSFAQRVASEEIESTFLLAILAVESLHGPAKVRMEATHAFDAEHRTCVIDASTAVGQDLNRLFIGFVIREFGEDSFNVHRIEETAGMATAEGRQTT